MQWTSPVPPPEELAKYKDVQLDAPERILAMAERQAEHRQFCEKIIVKANARNSTLGVISGFILGVLGIAGGVYLLQQGHEVGGYVSLIGSISILVGVTIYGYRRKSDG